MPWALLLVNISFTNCDDKNPEVQIGKLTPQKLYQISWRGTDRCNAWVVPNTGVGMQFINAQSRRVDWESYDEIDITYKIEGKYIIFNSNALYLGGAPWVIKSYAQGHITLIQNEASPDKEKVAVIKLDRID